MSNRRSLSRVSDSVINSADNRVTKPRMAFSRHRNFSDYRILRTERNRELSDLRKKLKTLSTQRCQHEGERDEVEKDLENLTEEFARLEEELSELEQHRDAQLVELQRCFLDNKNQITAKHEANMVEKRDELFHILEDRHTKRQQNMLRELEELEGECSKLQADIAGVPVEYQRALNEMVAAGHTNLELVKREKQEEVTTISDKIEHTRDQIAEQRYLIAKLTSKLSQLKDRTTEIEGEYNKVLEQWELTESNCRSIQQEIESQSSKLRELKEKITTSEENTAKYTSASERTSVEMHNLDKLKRELHNYLQDLKGNIRVFCRVRPLRATEQPAPIETTKADLQFKEHITLVAEQRDNINRSSGAKQVKKYDFRFDKVFDAQSSNSSVFEDISELVQSALNGFNVCIFAYGQTGSGKTYTMSHESGGMIPSAIAQIFREVERLKEQGWNFEIQAEFLEIYNETINDLVSSSGNIKHEIKHDETAMKTSVTGITKTLISSPEEALSLLSKAAKNRFTASTKANDKSSRSHSLFIFEVTKYNTELNQRIRGVLNLVDLAGSERLSHSQTTGDRFKETQAINKSLSSLGDVIAALGNNNNGSQHIPYRNSKLTYLLQYSLGGNSKTLMFVNVSPAQEHFNETLNSLRFATKVNSTFIGNARRNS